MIRLLCVISYLLLASAVWAASYSVEWGYTPPSSPTVTGFKLYKNSFELITFSGASIVSGVFTDTLVTGDLFELTAVFDDATESPKSSPFIWGGHKWVHIGTGVGVKTIKLSNGKLLRLQ